MTHTLISGPFDKPNGIVEVTILNRWDMQLYFRVKVTAVKSGTAPPKVGDILTVHQSKLTPRPDWDTWKQEPTSTPEIQSPS